MAYQDGTRAWEVVGTYPSGNGVGVAILPPTVYRRRFSRGDCTDARRYEGHGDQTRGHIGKGTGHGGNIILGDGRGGGTGRLTRL